MFPLHFEVTPRASEIFQVNSFRIQHAFGETTLGRSIYGVRSGQLTLSVRGTNIHLAVATLVNLYGSNPGKPSGRSKQRPSNPKSVPPCHGLRGSLTQTNLMRSPGDSGGLRISPVFREGELVHRREVIFWWMGQCLSLSALNGL